MTNTLRDEEPRDSINRLYNIQGDVTPDMYKLIDLLRQLINEEFVHNGKMITSQSLYDVLNPKIKTLINSEVTSVLDELIAQQWSFDDKDDALAVPTRYIQSIRSRYE